MVCPYTWMYKINMKNKLYMISIGLLIILLGGWILLIRHATIQHQKNKK